MTDAAPLAATPAGTPDGSGLFQDWLAHEGSKSWNPLDTSPDGGYEHVWMAWLGHLAAARPSGKRQDSASTLSTRQKALRQSTASAKKSRAWHEATADDVQRFLQLRAGQQAHHQPERQISEVTRRRYWRLLERIYEHALVHGWVTANPASGLEPGDRPAAEDGKGHCLPPLLWQSLPRHFPKADGYQDARDRAIVLLLYELALAPEEVRALLWRDVLDADLQPWSAASGQSRASSLHIDGARAAQQRMLTLSGNTAQALADWYRFSSAQRGPSVVDGEHPVFYSRRGGPLSVRMLFHVASQIIQRAHQALPEDSQKAPLQRVGPQVLRNTAIVQWLRAGRPELEVIAQIGVESTRALRHLQHYL
jgi:integrase